MKPTKTASILSGLLLMAGLAGCALFNKTELHHTRTTTIGKELVDLQEARDKGAISEEEHNKLKKALLSCGPHKSEIHTGHH